MTLVHGSVLLLVFLSVMFSGFQLASASLRTSAAQTINNIGDVQSHVDSNTGSAPSLSTANVINQVGLKDSQLSKPAEAQCIQGSQFVDAVQRFSKLIQFQTVSSPLHEHHVVEPDEFSKLDTFLRKEYAQVFEKLHVQKMGSGNLSYLMVWPGKQPMLLPALFLAHLDVVPVPTETIDQWTYPPFSGAITDDGFIWGRGALDDKPDVAAHFEALQLLVEEGWEPERTLYFAFGQDEEVGGGLGAKKIAEVLSARNMTFDIIMDEGGTIDVDGFWPYTDHPIAVIATAEKGYATLNVTVTTSGGHSSIPPINGTTTSAIVGRILTALDTHPPKSSLKQPVIDFIQALVPHMTGWRKQLFRWSSFPYISDAVASLLARDTVETAALVRTTVAVTGMQAGIAENVLPPVAKLRLNFRMMPGDDMDTLHAYLNATIGSDMAYVTVGPGGGQPADLATSVTPTTSPYFGLLKQAIEEVWKFPGGTAPIIAPYLMSGGTDSKHYIHLTRQGVLRHTPVSKNKTAGDNRRVHGLNERLRVADLGRAICEFKRVLELFSKP